MSRVWISSDEEEELAKFLDGETSVTEFDVMDEVFGDVEAFGDVALRELVGLTEGTKERADVGLDVEGV